MAKESEKIIQELVKYVNQLETRIKVLESNHANHVKMLKEHGVLLVHLKKSSRKQQPLK